MNALASLAPRLWGAGAALGRQTWQASAAAAMRWPATILPSPFEWQSRGHKTVSAVKKRFRLTGSGHIKRGHCGKRHGTGPLSRTHKQRLGQTAALSGASKVKVMRQLGK
ncbi:unnamed protein product [Phaeothamnion confervicola]